MKRISLFFATLAVVACKNPSTERVTGDDASAVLGQPSASSVSAPASATVAPPTTPTRVAKIEPNLLDIVPSKVAVSSAVQNPRDFPEHIVDGRLDTAWNGKTGDLVGGWIAFRVPKDAKVRRIELIVGYDKVKGDVDLFTANHRIKSVTVSRDGKKVLDHTFDTSKRALQAIDIDGPGGDYQIKVTATEPGTNPKWKELVVSELRVVGDPGKARSSGKDPVRVSVGGLDKEPDEIQVDVIPATEIVGPAADLAAVCSTWLRSLDATKKEREETAKNHELTLGGPSCKDVPLKMRAPFTGDATFKAVHAVRLSDGLSSRTQLVVDTPKGSFLLPISWAWDDPLDPGCPSIVRMYALRAARIENGHFLAVLDGDRTSFNEEGKPFPIAMTGVAWCKDGGSKPSCKHFDPQFHSPILGSFAIAPDGTLRMQ